MAETIHLLDPEMFNDRSPFQLKTKLLKAAKRLGIKIVSNAWIELSEADADRLAQAVVADLPPEATFRLTGAVLCAVCVFEKE